MALRRVAFDTNRYTDLGRGDPDAITVVRTADEVVLPFVVVAELRAGFLNGTRGAENERHLHGSLAQPRVSFLTPDDGTTHMYARLFLQTS